MLHGGVGAIEMFGEVLPLLAEGRRVIAEDLQAHGRTADIDRPMTFEAMADDVAALPRVVARDEWTAARKDLLDREKQFTRQRDALGAAGC